ncbi:universal stress protein [bacterium]|nr:universal stress protein [bacterium]
MKNILVGIEFRENFEMLIEKALEVSEPHDSKIWLIHVSKPDTDFVGFELGPHYIGNYRVNNHKEENKLLLAEVKRLKKLSVNAEAILLEGATAETILEEAKKLDIDLIICGHHAHGFLYKMIFKNTALSVARESEIPVLVVPFDIEHPEQHEMSVNG